MTPMHRMALTVVNRVPSTVSQRKIVGIGSRRSPYRNDVTPITATSMEMVIFTRFFST
ncbi:MAG: hypothetical protein IKF99_08135 [Oscillospiraceae bacterium]|nr:hypothetical protein [Oscillospiraceae bacterium]